MKKIFSCIVPVYNVENYLKRCLDSLTQQTFNSSFFEVILVDDGSTDDSGKICEDYSEKYENFIVYHKKNGGLSDARNYGINASNADYLIFIDSDDYIALNSLENLYKKVLTFNYPDMLAFNTIKIDSKTKIIKHGAIQNVLLNGKKYLMQELKNYFVASCSFLYNKNFLVQNNIYFTKGILHEDEDFTPRALLCAKTVCNVDLNIYYYIIREGSITTQDNKIKNAISIFQISNKLFHIFAEEDDILKREYYTHISKICFNTIEQAKLFKKENRNLIDYSIIKKTSLKPKEKIRYKLLKLSPYLLHFFTWM